MDPAGQSSAGSSAYPLGAQDEPSTSSKDPRATPSSSRIPQLERSGSNPARMDAIAKLKRAASNREMKGSNSRGPSPLPPAQSQSYDLPDQAGRSRVLTPQPPGAFVGAGSASTDAADSTHLAPSSNQLLQPFAPPASARSLSPNGHANLARSASASRAEQNRSPLPSLEQLRSRILHERLTAGLQRSASAGAASAAARAYALNKLLGQDTARPTSPVSDYGGHISEEEDEQTQSEEVVHSDEDDISKRNSKRQSRRSGRGSIYLRPASIRSIQQSKNMLRRSRTMSGMSQRAEEQRKIAFGQEHSLPTAPESPRKKRMSRLPPKRSGTGLSLEGTPEEPLSVVAKQRGPVSTGEPSSSSASDQQPRPQQQLTRQPSQREVARTEMMRKLSGRRPNGRSPALPPQASPALLQQRDEQINPDQSGANALLRAASEDGSESEQQEEGEPSDDYGLDYYGLSGDQDAAAQGPEEDDDADGHDYEEDEQDVDASGDASFNIPIQRREPLTFDQLPIIQSDSNVGGVQLTPEQQVTFLQMQQLLQQQQLQLQSARLAAPSEPSPAPLNPVKVPMTPIAKRNNSIATTTSPNSNWDSPGAQSALGANLIPSMHLAPFLSESGLERALSSDATRGARGERPVQDWPKSPSESSLGWSEAEPRSRLGSLPGDSLAPDGSAEEANESHETVRARRAPVAQPVLTTPLPGSNHQPSLSGSIVDNANLLRLPFEGNGPMSRHSAATSNGEGDHFLYDTYLANAGRSASTLGQFAHSPLPGNYDATSAAMRAAAGSPLSTLMNLRADQSGSKHALDASPAFEQTRQLSASGGSGLPSQTESHSPILPRLDTGSRPEEGSQVASGSSSATGASLAPSRVEQDLGVSPTLLKEIKQGIDWPQQTAEGVDQAPALTERQQQAPPGRNNSSSSSQYSEPPPTPPSKKTSLPRSPSGRRKAPPPIGNLEDYVSPSQKSSPALVATTKSAHTPPPRSAGLPAERSLADGTRQVLGGGGPVAGSSRQASDRLHTTAPVASSVSVPRPASPQGTRVTDASIRPAVQTSGSSAPSAWQSTSVGLDPQTLYRSRHHKVPSASQQDTETAFANGKLTPFPGLIRNPASSGSGHSYDLRAGESNRGTPSANTPIVQSPQMSSSRRQSPVQLQQHKTGSNSNVTFASPTTSVSTAGDRSVTIADLVEQEAQKTNAKASPSLFGSLRRKVSAVRKGSVRRKQPDTDVASSPVLVSPPASVASPVTQALSSAPQRALSPPQSANSQSGPPTSLSRRPSALQRLGSLGRRGARSPAVSSPVSTPPTTAAALPYEGMQDMSGPSIESHSRFAVQTPGQSPAATRIELNPDPLAGMANQPSSRGSGLPLGAKSLTQSPVHKLAASHHGRNDSLASVVEVARPSSPTVPVQQLPVGEDSLDSGYAEAPVSGFVTSQLEPKQADMLHRYSRVLTSTTRADADLPPGLTTRDLQSPPRELLKVSPVFQVVSASTIKDRFLILFNDILIVAKPIAPPGGNRQQDDNLPDIRWTFAVKKVLELRHLTLTVPKEHRTKLKHHPLQEVFVSAFARDPAGALDDIMTRTALAKTPSTIAHFLVQTPDLDKTVLTSYLCDSTRRDILTAYIKLQRVTGVSIESALRSVLMGLRFPSDSVAFEALLISFSSHWIEENKELIKSTFTSQLAADLTFAIMALNDALHGHKQLDSDFDESDIESEASHHQPDYEAPGIFTDAMPSLSKTAFVTAFRAHDPAYVLSDRTLLRIYTSVKTDPIQQALDFHELQHRKAIRVHGTGVPLKLVYGVTSEPITISIPEPDAGLAVRLYGRELIFDPPILSFENTTTRTFTITSRALGLRHAVFVRAGKNARFYSGSVSGPEATKSLQAAVAKGIIGDLPKSTVLTIERAFMQHSFTLTSSAAAASSQPDLPSTSSQRKFLFSVDDAVAKRQWVKVMQRAIDDSIERRAQLHEDIQSPASSDRAKGKRAASALALQVLKQALITTDANSESASAISRSKRGLLNDAGLQRSASASVSGTSSIPGRATPSGNDADVAGLQPQQRPTGPSPNLYRTPSDSRFAFKGAKGPPPSTFQRRGLEAALERNVSVSRHYYAADSGAGRAERDLLSPPMATPVQQAGRSYSGGSAHSNGSAVDVTLSHDIDGSTSGDVVAAGPSEVEQAPEEDEQTRARRMLGVARFLRSTAATAGGEAGLEERQVSGEELVTICTQNSLLPLVLERANMR